MTDIKERGDQMEEACGVFGIYAQDEHPSTRRRPRITVCLLCSTAGRRAPASRSADGKGIKHYRNLGLVPEVFDEEILARTDGDASPSVTCAIRPSAGKDVINAQPLVARCKIGMLALAHNGNLVNADAAAGADGGRRRDFPDDGGYRSHPEPDCAGKQQGA